MARGSTTAASANRDAGAKLAQQRLSVLELAKELGNVGVGVPPVSWAHLL